MSLLAYARSEVEPYGDAAMVGDRSHDVVGATNNGMQTIGVSYGYGSVEELNEAGAVRIAHSPEEVVHHVFNLRPALDHD